MVQMVFFSWMFFFVLLPRRMFFNVVFPFGHWNGWCFHCHWENFTLSLWRMAYKNIIQKIRFILSTLCHGTAVQPLMVRLNWHLLLLNILLEHQQTLKNYFNINCRHIQVCLSSKKEKKLHKYESLHRDVRA